MSSNISDKSKLIQRAQYHLDIAVKILDVLASMEVVDDNEINEDEKKILNSVVEKKLTNGDHGKDE